MRFVGVVLVSGRFFRGRVGICVMRRGAKRSVMGGRVRGCAALSAEICLGRRVSIWEQSLRAGSSIRGNDLCVGSDVFLFF